MLDDAYWRGWGDGRTVTDEHYDRLARLIRDEFK